MAGSPLPTAPYRPSFLPAMKSNRRDFLKTAGLGAGALTLLTPAERSTAASAPTFAPTFVTQAPRMKLGIVTYNLAKDWDIPTLIKNCEAAKLDGVELRTTHAHKVEVELSEPQRAEVKKRFQNSKVELMGLGSTFDYHTPDPNKLKKDIAATKDYIVLAHDVGAAGVKVRPNGLPKEVPKEKTLSQIGTALRELGEFGQDHGVAIRLEVHGSETSLLPNIRTILDAANHPNVGACWNSNASDLSGEGFDRNFDLVKNRINAVHMRDLYLEDYPFRRLLTRLNEINYRGYCLAEIPESADPVRVMRYYRALWLAYQGLL
jgi:sugar phosphate isomerase/epimerase